MKRFKRWVRHFLGIDESERDLIRRIRENDEQARATIKDLRSQVGMMINKEEWLIAIKRHKDAGGMEAWTWSVDGCWDHNKNRHYSPEYHDLQKFIEYAVNPQIVKFHNEKCSKASP